MTTSPEDNLHWLPTAEFERVLGGITDRHDRLRAFSALSRINTLYMVMRAGSGHLGSSFSAADLVTWLLLEETGGDDVFFSSKGHDAPGLYAALIGLGKLDESLVHRLRRLGGLPGHPDVRTPHMPFNTGSLGMGISKAKGLVLANRLLGRDQRVFVLTGDGELQEGQNYEALGGAANAGMGELTVIVDHNKIQSDTWVGDVNDLGDLEARFAGFGWGVLRCDGHDFGQIEKAFRRRAEQYAGRPAVIIADTVKGGGCPTFAATSMPLGEWRYRFHSGAPAPDVYAQAHAELLHTADTIVTRNGLTKLAPRASDARPPVKATGPSLPEVYGRALLDAALRDERIVAMDADLVLDTGLIPFTEKLPERFIECGIAEQDMVSMASGLAARGLVPFVHSFSCFLHARPNEHIYNNATEGRRVIYVGSLAGVLPAAPGHSHQAVRDVSAVGAVPGLVVLEPAGPVQVGAAVEYCASTTDSVYLRLVSAPVPPEVVAMDAGPSGAAPLEVGRGTVVRQGGSTVAIGAGPVVLGELLRAAETADLTVVNLPWLNRVDPAWLADLASGAERIVVVENHYTRGGQADLVARALLELDLPATPRFRGVGLTGVPVCGTADEVLDAHGLSAARLAATLALPEARPEGETTWKPSATS
ncbi:1-deoxy-D-xylulose-5-phosphate synthase N-terminal domain-containing protein [Actinomadura hibisca]|uniref:1-deoxy-D-xylulose-5-phosphate synthase N-terminal domain-containing protein n=1 Tax=Actinomadura hibisca TaxID=68565 RepID=UPI00082B081F|nr:1-deoxy-D-xylulose-5-phosphate synthase N-terminal domain-containing protein [Actinomadura hibisca]